MYAGMLSAVSGILLVARTAAGNPTYGLAYELDAIASTVIGGTSLSGGIGSIPLCVVGAMIIGVLNNGMDLLGVNAYWQQIVKGIIIVVAVVIDSRKRRRK
jgi:inositol transport system permease protein